MISLVAIFAVILLSAAIAMTLRNLIHSALLLTLNWLGIAAFYLWAGAEFVAFAQVLVYVGAVSMIVLFAVLLTRQSPHARVPAAGSGVARGISALVTGAVVAGVLCAAVVTTEFDLATEPSGRIGVQQIGRELAQTQAAALLAIGVLLTVALIGAVVIAARESGEGTE
jgi:NADH:ubiquinone oxidoreductase subunit 6 (subunit J)